MEMKRIKIHTMEKLENTLKVDGSKRPNVQGGNASPASGYMVF